MYSSILFGSFGGLGDKLGAMALIFSTIAAAARTVNIRFLILSLSRKVLDEKMLLC
jgi:hypothetical protein